MRRQSHAEIDRLLHDAWLTLGGDLGSSSIMMFAARPNLNKAKREFLDIALRRDPHYAPTQRHLGLYYEAIKNSSQAEQAYRNAIAIDPEYADAHYNLGVLLAEDPERQDEAEQAYRNTIAIDPDYTSAHNNLGLLFGEDPKRQDEAEQAYRNAIAIDPDYTHAHHNLGVLLAKDPERQDEAEQAYRKAIAIDPDYTHAHNNLKVLLAKR